MKNLIYGKHVVIEFLKNHPQMVIKVYTSHLEDLKKEHLIDERLLIKSTNEKMSKMFNEVLNHQGYVAEVKEFNYLPFNEMVTELMNAEKELVLILDQIHDPYNFGAILRSAALNNVHHVIILDRKQVMINETVIKTSGGTAYSLQISKVPNLIFAIEKLKDLGFWIYASNLNTKAKSLREIEFAKKTVLIIGNEQKGISNLLTESSDINVYIPSTKIIDSYNASVAAGILMYEISTQLKLL